MGILSTRSDKSYQRHPLLGDVKLLSPQTHPYLQKQLPITNQKQVQVWLRRVNTLDYLNTPDGVLFLPLKYQYEKRGMCGSSGYLHLIYEDYSFLLSIELVNRAQLNKPLLEEEMWYILYSLVKVGSLYERTDRKMGDVQPSNIVINEEGNVKFAGVDAWPNRLDNYQAVCCDRSRPVFLAPEECMEQFIRRGDYPPNTNKHTAEVFSIGMTLLQTATLKQCSKMYMTRQDYSINYQQLRRCIDSLTYSPLLSNLIDSFLAIDPSARPSCREIEQILLPYARQIDEMMPFVFNARESERLLMVFRASQGQGGATKWMFPKLMGQRRGIGGGGTNGGGSMHV